MSVLNGWLIIDKALGTGSTQCVSAVKRALRDGGYAKAKVGHGGTLDPLATGVLPIAVGEATKLAGRMLDSDKVYEFTVRFGEQTDTLDAEGAVVARSDTRPGPDDIETVLPAFTGMIEQMPPAYSALKVDGTRAYDLARAGREVTLAKRSVMIHSLAPCDPGRRETGEGTASDTATLTAYVGKGTYIRSLARDIALALGTVGHVTYLRRIRAGPFDLSRAISLDNLAKVGNAREIETILLPLRAGLDDIPAMALTPDQAGALRAGRILTGLAEDDGRYFAMLGDVPVALVEAKDHAVRVVRGFNL